MKIQGLRVLILLFCAGLVACAPPVTGLVKDKSFNYHNLSITKLAVIGVDSSLDPLTAAERSRYSDMLLRQFREERGQFSYIPAGDVANQVGQDVYHQILDNYGVTGTLSEDHLRLFASELPKARYGILARLEHTDVRQTRDEGTADVKSYKKVKDENGKEVDAEPTEVDVTLKFSAIRDISVSMLIYDFTSGEAVWSGTLNQSYNETNEQSRRYDKDDRWEQELLELALREIVAKRSERDLYPEAPSLSNSLERVFAGFAMNMPEE